ncbi:MAG: hypothetical protein ABFR90_05950 [Planctomycetota bacterium]
MRYKPKLLLCAVLMNCAFSAHGQVDKNKPQIGYLYPAGGQQGKTIQVSAGGQFLRGAGHVYISGEGVTAKVIRHVRPFRNLNGDQRRELQRRLGAVRDQRLAELPPQERKMLNIKGRPAGNKERGPKTADKTKDKPANVKLPDHPLLQDLENKSLQELAHIAYYMSFPRSKLQQNRQLSETVLLEISVAPDAKPGMRKLRIETREGLTNPMAFQVGLVPEINELEPNDKNNSSGINALFRNQNIPALKNTLRPEPLELPVVLNGQIMPGDTDRFRFRAKTGQQLVIETHARSLIPYLADAVPGWFQATVALYNAAGKEMAFADDYRFNPDPVMFYKIPRDGIYELEIRDSIYRGRQDFVYRVAIGTQPFITQLFPLGGKEGAQTVAAIDGWNLPKKQLTLDTQPGQSVIRQKSYSDGKTVSNLVPYAVTTLPECTEVESNDTIQKAQKIELPNIVNGQILKPGDVDVFRFSGKAGDTIAIEVYARRLNSPLDSLLRLTDASGKPLQWNDDHVEKEQHLHKDILGLQTHHADSYLLAELPKDGDYFIHLADSQHHGSAAHSYRLRVADADGDFSLRVTPSGITVPAGSVALLTVHAMRKDGFEGPIELFVKKPDAGFKISGGLIPAEKNSVRMTLAAPDKMSKEPIVLELEGRARIGDTAIRRRAVGADDTMQAFLYRHLVPAQELLVLVPKSRWRMPPVELADGRPVKIPAGGSAQVRLKTKPRPLLKEIDLTLYEPPAGVTLHDVTVVPDGMTFTLKADKDSIQSGLSDNLIIQMSREHTPKQQKGKPAPKKRRDSLGVLPAIPIEIVKESGAV